jgi:hypothetical protein
MVFARGLLSSLALVLLVAGCQGALKDRRRVDVKSAEVKEILYDVQQREKSVQIVIESESAPVDAYLVLEADRARLAEQLANQGKPTGFLASGVRSKEITLQGRIPAKSAFAVLLTCPKDTAVVIRASESR